MLLIKTILKSSKIHGIGLFAAEDIPSGITVFRWEPDFDREISSFEFAKLPRYVREYIEKYAYLDSGSYFLCADNAKFENHSLNPNLISSFDSFETYAADDIYCGEELTSNYYLYDEAANRKLK